MSKKLVLLSVLTLISLARAQQVGLVGPVQGYIFDPPSRSIRAVTGFLGSASLVPAALALLDFGSIAPGQNYGIAIRSGQVMFVSGLGTSQFSTLTVETGASVPDGAVWSGDGSVAVLYSRSANWVQIYTGFPGAVIAGTQFTIPAGGSLTTVAADGAGQRVVIGVGGSGVYQIAADGSLSLLLAASDPISLSFSGDSSTLYALDSATNQVFELSVSSLAVQTWAAGLNDAIALCVGVDGTGQNVLYVAGGSSQTLISVSRATHQVIATVPLSFTPSIIEPLGSNGFALTRRSLPSDILWTFTNTAQPAIYFVPAITLQAPRREVPRP